MAWIRQVQTASRATTVQSAESVDGRQRIVRHTGLACDEVKLGLVIGQTLELLTDDGQGQLELGI